MTATKWIVLLCIGLIGTNVIWLYSSLDNGVTLTHQSIALEDREKTIDLLLVLILELPRNAGAQETFQLLKRRLPDEIVKQYGDTIEVGEVILQYKQDKLVHISTM